LRKERRGEERGGKETRRDETRRDETRREDETRRGEERKERKNWERTVSHRIRSALVHDVRRFREVLQSWHDRVHVGVSAKKKRVSS